MKKLLLLCLTTISAAAVVAQPTITGATNNPVAGETFYGHYCDTAGISKGATGTAVTWNFAGLSAMGDDTITFVTCASTPYCDSFPGSNLAISDGDDGYSYFITDAGRFAFNGYGSASGSDNQHYTDPENFMSYPLTYTTSRVDSYASYQFDSTWLSYGTDSFRADAYGTLILPSGTYTNALRIHVITTAHDSSTTGGPVWNSRYEKYMWYTPGFHFPLVMMFYDTSAGETYLSDVTYYTRNSTAVTDVHAASSGKVYPNPARGTFNVVYNSYDEEAVTVSLIDMTGRRMLLAADQQVRVGANTFHYDVSALPPGVYTLQMRSGNNVVNEKVTLN